MDIKTVNDLKRELNQFGVADYAVFSAMLFGCSGVGIWYAWRSSKQSSAAAEDEYIVGGRSMAVFPISMSLVATFISGIALVGYPTEMYLYGTEFLTVLIIFPFMAATFGYFYLPVFLDLSLNSTYEYLERRFSRRVRLLGSVLFSMAMMSWLPIVIYVPALAFNQVTGINVHVITPVVCAVCIFYTCLGGIKAVVWTDVIQTCVMVGSMILTICKGTWDVGGLSVFFERNLAGDRLVIPDWTWDFTRRHSIQGIFVGSFVAWINTLLNQNMIQRFMALPSYRHSLYALTIYTLGVFVILIMGGYTGLLAYAMYYDCDPLTTKLATNKDQILPLMVMRILGSFPGLPGLFVAGVFSASLSSLSTGLNSMAAVVLEDFVRTTVKRKLSSRTNLLILKSVVVIFGIISVLMVFVVEQLGTILQMAISLGSLANGPVFGMFTSAIFIPWVNDVGAFYGGIIGLLSGGLLIFGNQIAIMNKKIIFQTKPLVTDGCDYYYNASFVTPVSLAPSSDDETFILFRLSYLWYMPLISLLTISSAFLISCATGGPSAEVDPRAITPCLRRWVSKPKRKDIHERLPMMVPS